MARPPRDEIADIIGNEITDARHALYVSREIARIEPGHLENAIEYSLRTGGITREGVMHSMGLPTRQLGRTGQQVTIFGLGGEGILRSTGHLREARVVIEAALASGVNYFDTAPAYQQSRDYLGSVIGELSGERKNIFLASKTHARDYEGSMNLLEDTLRRLRTEYLDLWQLHDLRTQDDIDKIFSTNGAIHALEEAKRLGLVRHVGITGHTDPEVLIQAMQRYNFDTILLPVNAGDKHYLPFVSTVIPEARKRGMGIIGMKVTGQGHLLEAGLTMRKAFSYALSQDIDIAIIGCGSQREVEENAYLARTFKPMPYDQRQSIERQTTGMVVEANFFKKGMP